MLLECEKKKIKNYLENIGPNIKLEDLLCVYIEYVLEKNNWNKTRSAKSLGVSIRTFRDWTLRRKNIHIPEEKKWKRLNFGKK